MLLTVNTFIDKVSLLAGNYENILKKRSVVLRRKCKCAFNKVCKRCQLVSELDDILNNSVQIINELNELYSEAKCH